MTCQLRPCAPGLSICLSVHVGSRSLYSPPKAKTCPEFARSPAGTLRANSVLSASPEVDVEGMEFGPGELDSVGSSSDVDDHYSLQSDGGYGPPCRRPARPGLS